MKPGKRNRKLMAWLALGEPDANRASPLRAHLRECEGCRSHFEELSHIAEALRDPILEPAVEASEGFHRRLLASLRTADRATRLRPTPELFDGVWSSWPVVLPPCRLVPVGSLAVITLSRPGEARQQRAERQQPLSGQRIKFDFEPTISNYKTVAMKSPDRFDELVIEQGSRNLSPGVVYPASALPLAAKPD